MKEVASRLGVNRKAITKAHASRFGGDNAWRLARRDHGGGNRIRQELCGEVVDYWVNRTRPLPITKDQKYMSRARDPVTGTHLRFRVFIKLHTSKLECGQQIKEQHLKTGKSREGHALLEQHLIYFL